MKMTMRGTGTDATDFWQLTFCQSRRCQLDAGERNAGRSKGNQEKYLCQPVRTLCSPNAKKYKDEIQRNTKLKNKEMLAPPSQPRAIPAKLSGLPMPTLSWMSDWAHFGQIFTLGSDFQFRQATNDSNSRASHPNPTVHFLYCFTQNLLMLMLRFMMLWWNTKRIFELFMIRLFYRESRQINFLQSHRLMTNSRGTQ